MSFAREHLVIMSSFLIYTKFRHRSSSLLHMSEREERSLSSCARGHTESSPVISPSPYACPQSKQPDNRGHGEIQGSANEMNRGSSKMSIRCSPNAQDLEDSKTHVSTRVSQCTVATHTW